MDFQIVYKPIGKTCGEIIDDLRKVQNYETIAYAGRLDPMAHGDLIIVFNLKLIDKFNNMNKIYKFKFVIGISTDSTDQLGMLENNKYSSILDMELLQKHMLSFRKSTFQQQYHKLSSFVPKNKHNGKRKPLWWWSIKYPEVMINIPSKEVSVFDINIDNIKNISSNDLRDNMLSNIDSINESNNLRQAEVSKQWQEYKFEKETLIEITTTIHVSSGFYIRQFVKDLSDFFKVKMIVTEINRTKIIL